MKGIRLIAGLSAVLVVLSTFAFPGGDGGQAYAQTIAGLQSAQADTGAAASVGLQAQDTTSALGEQPKESPLEGLVRQVRETAVKYFPSVVGALVVLVLGWLLAVFVAWIVRSVLKRSKLDEKLARWTAGEDEISRLGLTGGIAKGFFYLVMLFVIVAVLQALELTVLTDPINLLLGRVFEFIPQLIGAALLLIVAWILASLIRLAVTKALVSMRFDEGFSRQTEKKLPHGFSLSEAIGTVLYWIVFLLFLPAILGTLNMKGLFLPIQNMLDKIVAVLPNVFAAVVIFVVGWLIARIVSRLVTNLLAAFGTDRATERIGLKTALGDHTVSGLIGTLVYALIIIPVAIATLHTLQIDAISLPAIEMLTRIMNAVPSIFAAALILIIAYIVARLLKGLVSNVLKGIGFNRLPVLLGLSDEPVEGDRSPSEVVSYVVIVAVMFFATIEALNQIGFRTLAELLTTVVAFGGRVILALAILGIGLYLANLAHRLINSSGTSQSKIYAQIVRFGIIIFVAAMALREMGIADEIVNLAFGILLGSIAVAAAIAFGLGSREIAGRHVEKWLQRISGSRK